MRLIQSKTPASNIKRDNANHSVNLAFMAFGVYENPFA